MADNTWQKELKRATDNIGAVRTDVYLVKKWQAAWILGFACIMLIGLIMQLVTANLNVRAVGLILVLVGAVAIVAVYLIMRYRGPLNYTTYYYQRRCGIRPAGHKPQVDYSFLGRNDSRVRPPRRQKTRRPLRNGSPMGLVQVRFVP